MFCKTQTYIYLGSDKVRLIKIQYDVIYMIPIGK